MTRSSLKDSVEEILEDNFYEILPGDDLDVVIEDGFEEVIPGSDLESFFSKMAEKHLAGYDCPVCKTVHTQYFSHGTGDISSVERKVMDIKTTVEDEVIECENGFMMTRLSLLEYNTRDAEKNIRGDFLTCPACDAVHHGEYSVVKDGGDGKDIYVMCPSGRIMPRSELLNRSYRKLMDRIERSMRREVIRV